MKEFVIICLFVISVWADPIGIVSIRSGRIIGGNVANAGEFPFAAAIYKQTNNGIFFCTGSLMSDQWILTAGQCVEGATLFTIRLGSNGLNSNDPNAVRVATDQYYLHPDYDGFLHDIALIKLRMPIGFNDYIRPVSLISRPPANYLSVITFGWGQTSDAEPGPVENLNYVFMTTLSIDECRSIFGSVIADEMVCASGNYNEGTCRGDLGSPLLQYSNTITSVMMIGVSSFISSSGCESTDPSGFTKIHPYMSWINEIIVNN